MYQKTNRETEEVKFIKKEIENQFPEVWAKLFKITPETLTVTNGMRFKRDNKKEIEKLKKKLQAWEIEVQNYSRDFRDIFDLDLFDETNPDRYSYNEFKTAVFAKDLWTVSSALHTRDPELDQYKESFREAEPIDIHSTVKVLLESAAEYAEKDIAFNRCKNIQDLELDYLHEDEYMLQGVIGRGIRSEILHRLYPNCFAMMTQRNLWGIYFLTKAEEFLVDLYNEENRTSRTSPDWEYDYPRFSFYSNFIANMLEANLKELGLSMKSELRFGYVNLFLQLVSEDNKAKINEAKKWKIVRV